MHTYAPLSSPTPGLLVVALLAYADHPFHLRPASQHSGCSRPVHAHAGQTAPFFSCATSHWSGAGGAVVFQEALSPPSSVTLQLLLGICCRFDL